MSAEEPGTVATYLMSRLEELGVDRIFGVAGNYTAALLDTILEDPSTHLSISGSANEMCAGFAADAYARYRGFGATFVTYSVGAFSMLNTIAGSFVERVPVLMINGAPTNKQTSIERNVGLLYSHTTGYDLVDINMFRPITAAAERITDAVQAPYQIDSALTAMLTQQRPGYLELTEDVWRAECRAPAGSLVSGSGAIVTRPVTADAVAATLELLTRRPKVVLWAGADLGRLGLQDEFTGLLRAINRRHAAAEDRVRFVTTASSKAIISETHPLFEGCVTLGPSEINRLVGDDGALLGIGGWTTSKDIGHENIRGPGTVLAADDGVVVGSRFFPLVALRDYIEQLTAAFEPPTHALQGVRYGAGVRRLRVPSELVHRLTAPLSAEQVPGPVSSGSDTSSDGVTYDEFFGALGDWLTADDILVSDAGFPLIGAQAIPIERTRGFLAQAAWLSIGYSVPAATGVKCANPDARAVVVVGDGAFQETCQAISDHTAHGQNTVVFVLSNGLYGIEQFLVNPNPFRTPPEPRIPVEEGPYRYNRLPEWDIVALARGFGATGQRVSTVQELQKAMAEVRVHADMNAVIEVRVPQRDLPAGLRASADGVGEDEIDNPAWPSSATF